MTTNTDRRRFLASGARLAAAAGFPLIVPSSVFGKNAPSNRIQVGVIGAGRIAREHDMPEVWKDARAHIIAVCDVDARRVALGRELVDRSYAARTGKPYASTLGYANYRELLANGAIDAVVIATPDRQHAGIAADAVRAKKDVYLQKPAALTIAEGRYLANVVADSRQILQIGSQQRSLAPWPQFHRACELVRNGRIGALRQVEIGLPGDPSGPQAPPMPVPPTLDYQAWLGSTPQVYYTELRVHPQQSFERPGWLRCEQFGAGMITGWGSHHVDIAHWGMDTEHTGPVEIWGSGEFPSEGLWNVHGKFKTHARYANGVVMTISGDLPNGVKFIGTEGWIFVTRSGAVTSSDPAAPANTALVASNPKILASVIGKDEVRLYRSAEQHTNWLDTILSRQQPIATAEIGHRSCSTCLLHHIAMKSGRRLRWDPRKERFIDDDAANQLLSRPQRQPGAAA